MGSYHSDDEALIGLARQLADAYAEARRREDQDYACESIAQFLSEFRESAPSEALLALLDLPLTAETYPLVDEVQVALASRGPAVVELLLEAVLGEVYDPDGPAPERAAETLGLMPPGEASLGLVEVICGHAGDDVKAAAVDGLVALGGLAEPDLAATLHDPEGGEWAAAALEQIRFELEHPSFDADEALDAGADFDDAAGDDEEVGADSEDAAAAQDSGAVVDDVAGSVDDAARPPLDDEPEAAKPAPETVTGPDGGVVDTAYEDFLKRFEQDDGGEPLS